LSNAKRFALRATGCVVRPVPIFNSGFKDSKLPIFGFLISGAGRSLKFGFHHFFSLLYLQLLLILI